MEFEINKENVLPIRQFLNQYRSEEGIRVPKEKYPILADLFKNHARIVLNLQKPPLSTMETLVIASSLIHKGYQDRAYVLGVSANTLRYHESQVKIKLRVHSKVLALCKSIQLKIIEIF